MDFHSYKPYKKRNLFPKFTIVFLLGMSFALFFSNAFTIVTGIENATQYIKQIILTADWTTSGVTGIVLDGTNSRVSANYWCDSDLKNCKKNNVSVWTDNSIITITWSTSNIINRWNYSVIWWWISNSISWNYSAIPWWNSNIINSSYSFAAWNSTSISHNNTFIRNWSRSQWISSVKSGTFIINAPNWVWIKTSNPQEALDVNWNISVSWIWKISWNLQVDWNSYLSGIVWINVSSSTNWINLEVNNVLRITPQTLSDNACSVTWAIIYDTTSNLCFCNGSSRRLVTDWTTICYDSWAPQW